MRYGLSLGNGGPCADARTMAELARMAEESGWDGIFLEDYIVYHDREDLPTYDPWVVLATMVLATESVRLGTAVTALPRRRPWKLARELVTLDHLSGGRMILGVGLGHPPEFARFGEPDDARLRTEMLDEGLEILDGLWRGERFRYEGRHYRLDDVTFNPRPVQRSRIPIWIGGSSERRGPVERAARWDGMVPVPVGGRHLTPDEVRRLKSEIEMHRPSGEPFDLALGGLARGDDPVGDQAVGALEEAGATWWIEWVPPGDLETMRAAINRGPLSVAG